MEPGDSLPHSQEPHVLSQVNPDHAVPPLMHIESVITLYTSLSFDTTLKMATKNSRNM